MSESYRYSTSAPYLKSQLSNRVMISKMFQTKWCPSSLDLKMNSSTCQALHTMTYLSIRSKQTCFGTWNTICPDLLMGTMLLRRISSRVSIHFSCRVDSLSITRGRTPSNQYLEEKNISWLREQSQNFYTTVIQ